MPLVSNRSDTNAARTEHQPGIDEESTSKTMASVVIVGRHEFIMMSIKSEQSREVGFDCEWERLN
jgi:hypothetical protein